MDELTAKHRKQQSRIAYYGSTTATGGVGGSAIALEAAIQQAIRVRITDSIVKAVWDKTPAYVFEQPEALLPLLSAAFEAAGFEVVD